MSDHEQQNVPEPGSPEHWRQLLRRETPPEEIGELPLRQRRRARKTWRSARRAERAQWIRTQRANTPTGVHIPLTALVLAATIGLTSWLWPQHSGHARPQAAPATPSTTAAPSGPPISAAPAPSTTPTTASMTPAQIAAAFMTAYCTRMPPKDGSHTVAVARAAAYASAALVDNLDHFDDHDFDVLVSRQVSDAQPTAVTVSEPTAAQRPAPDTPLRVYLQANAAITASGTNSYTYQRSLTLEVSRADVGDPWMVTRILGLAR